LALQIDAFPQHTVARRWWEDLLNGERTVGIAPSSYSASSASPRIGKSSRSR
jgi:hypothetical protein